MDEEDKKVLQFIREQTDENVVAHLIADKIGIKARDKAYKLAALGYLHQTVNKGFPGFILLPKGERFLWPLRKRIMFELTSQLLAAHIVWPKAFAKIESLLQGQVQFESMSGNVLESTLDISGFAPNYSIIAKQIASFLSDIGISDVMISKTNSLPNGKIQFDMRLKFNKSDFVQ